MSKIIDWTLLKEGDIFTVEKWCHTITLRTGIAEGFLGQLYTMHNGYISFYGGTASLIRHPSHPSFKEYDCYTANQPVEVLTEDKIPPQWSVNKLGSAKLNNMTGTDPEVFVVRGVEKEELLPAFKFLPPQEAAFNSVKAQLNFSGGFHPTIKSFAYRDGFAAESFVSPCTCHGYLIDFIRDGLLSIKKAAQKFDRTARLTTKSTFVIPEITIANATDEDVALGCMPSQNAYGAPADLNLNARDFRMRFAGGHVHLGFALDGMYANPTSKILKEKIADSVKGCDLIAGMATVAMFAGIDDPIRRQYYGKAGEFRQPKHGIEYRTLSNAWLADPRITHLVFNLVRAGLRVGWNGMRNVFGIVEEEVQEIINFCDVKAARKFLTVNKTAFDILLSQERLVSNEKARRAFEIVTQGGVHELFPDYEQIETNWKLTDTWMDHSNNSLMTWSHRCGEPLEK